MRRGKLLRSAFAAFGLCALLAACDKPEDEPPYQGYAEGEYVRVASPFGGRLTALFVARGDNAEVGTPLFSLDSDYEAAARRQAAEKLQQAEASLADLTKGKRPAEIDVLEQQLAQAQSDAALSRTRLARQEQLAKEGVVAQDALDAARSASRRDVARVAEAKSSLDVARLAARSDQIVAAEREVAAQKAALEQAEWTLAQKSVLASRAGLVEDTLYVEGEWVPAGSPVVSLLPPENIKLRFYVPESDLGALKVGDAVSVACDGCGTAIAAKITYLSPQAEYTPPVIYSNESRAKLVYLAEARSAPQDATRLRPGQPVQVRFVPPDKR